MSRPATSDGGVRPGAGAARRVAQHGNGNGNGNGTTWPKMGGRCLSVPRELVGRPAVPRPPYDVRVAPRHSKVRFRRSVLATTSETGRRQSQVQIGEDGEPVLAQVRASTPLAQKAVFADLKEDVCARVARDDPQVTVLDFPKRQVRDDEAGGLATALRRNTRVTVLNLSSNDIGDAGATQLAQMLERNVSITAMDLQGNCLGTAAVAAFSRALRSNFTLVELDLDPEEVGSERVEGEQRQLAADAETGRARRHARQRGGAYGGADTGPSTRK